MSFLKLNNLNSHVAKRCGQETPKNFGKNKTQEQHTSAMLSKARNIGKKVSKK